VATPSQVRFKAKKVALAVALAALIVLLLAFPAELFNKTYDENEEEIHTVLTRVGLRRHHLQSRIGLLVFVLVGAGMTVWLALGEGPEGNPIAFAVGIVVALPVVTFAFELPAELYLRTRSRIVGKLHVLPTALAVGVICALVSRLLRLEPTYLYGIFASFVAAREGSIAEEEEGKSVLVGTLAMVAVAGLCWFGWGALNGDAHGAHRDWAVILFSTTLFWVFVLSAEGLVFGLMPLKYLDGSLLRRWRTSIWLVCQLAAASFFVYVIMMDGSTKKIDTFSQLIRPYALFIGFGLVSFAFWRYFQWDGRPTALDESADEGEEQNGEGEEQTAPIPVAATGAGAEVPGEN
jgi:hypothetical protein